ncbi:MAG TPA: endonuclease/exonuclease/phosphatase family protein [Saliniramus sp.]|nr:endonuclease/exonuclease/phosphatase family protein [Saliniramus sp.]
MKLLRWILTGLGGLAILATVLPLLPSNSSAIRIWDFPRTQVAVLLAAALFATPFLLPLRRRRTGAFAALVAGALAWQAYAIWPYTPLVETQAKELASCPSDSRVTLLVANVLIENRNAAPLLALVERVSPDLVLLMETDAWWDARLAPLKETYPHEIAHPQEDSYGIHLFSRLALIEPEVRFLVEEDVPSIRTGLTLPSGTPIKLYGLHPKPPPLQDTEERDAELLIVGKEVRDEAAPSIVAGDLNDVAWSRSNSLFQEVSGLLDPRIGRGLYATYNADWPLLKWPLDHAFFHESFRLLDVAVLGDIGSDHFPFFVALCHDPSAPAVQEQPEPEASDLEEADEVIEEGREEARE